MDNKTRLMVMFGGQSEEYYVSLLSCESVLRHIDKDKYLLYLVGVTKSGQWMLFDGDVELIRKNLWQENSKRIVFPADPTFGGFFVLDDPFTVFQVDVVFPIMHGPHAEDGTLQGVFELANIPYVGSSVVSSAVCMDKAFSKMLFKANDIPSCNCTVVSEYDFLNSKESILNNIRKEFTYPVFVKPSNMGSSVGVSKATDEIELINALTLAFKFDRKVLVEEFIDGREIECSVLGNERPIASIPGEIEPSNEFYDYDAKYISESSKLIIPAPLDEQQIELVKELAVKTYKALDCSGMARVDFFLERTTGRILVSEINTLPGFTNISMYPKLLEKIGIAYKDTIEKLIELSLDRHSKGVK